MARAMTGNGPDGYGHYVIQDDGSYTFNGEAKAGPGGQPIGQEAAAPEPEQQDQGITQTPDDWYAQAAKDYNDNPLAARGGEGGPAFRPASSVPGAQPAATGGMPGGGATGGAGSYGYGTMGGGGGTSNTGYQPNTGYQAGGPGTPIPGGSSAVSMTPAPSVNQMAQPYGGGPGMTMQKAGFQPGSATMPKDLMEQYKSFLQNPASAQSNPMYGAMMDAGLQATERGMLAKGMQGSGNMLTELQKTGMGVAGQFLPTMANMYGQGAQTEADRFGIENRANLGAGTLGLSQWQAEAGDQLNRARADYGVGQDQRAQLQAIQAQQQYQPLMNMMTMRAMQGY